MWSTVFNFSLQCGHIALFSKKIFLSWSAHSAASSLGVMFPFVSHSEESFILIKGFSRVLYSLEWCVLFLISLYNVSLWASSSFSFVTSFSSLYLHFRKALIFCRCVLLSSSLQVWLFSLVWTLLCFLTSRTVAVTFFRS